jgi:hypothetical protein
LSAQKRVEEKELVTLSDYEKALEWRSVQE